MLAHMVIHVTLPAGFSCPGKKTVRDKKPFGRVGDAAAFGYGDKIGKLLQCHEKSLFLARSAGI